MGRKDEKRLDALQAEFLKPFPRVCPKCGRNVVTDGERAKAGFCRACAYRAKALALEQMRAEGDAMRAYKAANMHNQRNGAGRKTVDHERYA